MTIDELEIESQVATLSTFAARAGRRYVESDLYARARAAGAGRAPHILAGERIEVLDGPELRQTLGLPSFDIEGVPFTADLPSAALLPGAVEMIELEKLQAELAPELSENVLATAVPAGTPLPEGAYNAGATPTLELLQRFGVAVPVTLGELDEPGQVQSIIERRMKAGIGLGLENDLLNGNNFWTGMIAAAESVPSTIAKSGGQYRVDALAQACGTVWDLGWYQSPLCIVAYPTTIANIVTERDGNTRPLPVHEMLRHFVGPKPAPIFVPSRFIPAGTALVGDAYSSTAVFTHGGLEIGLSPNYLDFLARGMVMLALEFRAWAWVRQPAALCAVTGVQ
jgi:hypothetical protein